MENQLSKYEMFKRKLYLHIIPILVLALLTSLFNFTEQEPINKVMLPLLTIFFSLSLILIYYKKWMKFIEIANLAMVSVFHLVKSFEIVALEMAVSGEFSTGRSTYWTPLLFVFIFILLNIKKGIIYALILWGITVSLGLLYWNDISPQAIDMLIQYYLSTLVYIIFLFLARHIISAYTKSEVLEKMAFQDALTGIANRRKVYQWLENKLEAKEIFSVVFFDLDHFKQINDRFGHVVGDRVLTEVAALIKSNLAKDDYFGRWGGEEFIIISHTRDKQKAIKFAEKIRNKIENYQFAIVGNITSSFGVDVSRGDDTTEILIKRVDEALYLAKNEGRNRVRYLEN
ncbi:diguanylate cyclase [Aquibacillus halophilus]|uniref:Diguanylate cyclase n=1 Tax=Aquibacillus halophilus TaxID=930132 RepID=A0A6A8D7S0_9BACI|nr:GGDEF domain-containing protein [Aquibacillus halophilus]MRH41803.1 diguanylate cyclase [Aquibacillus halophilus]